MPGSLKAWLSFYVEEQKGRVQVDCVRALLKKGDQSLTKWQEAGRSEGQVSKLDVPRVSDKAHQAQSWNRQI